ncbi:CGNR zinc finger domain-containing protein [Streptomyces sp. AV19]|uniref:CGNR zinc finger domain-containing protein n=1 Tax=Streptomyces sp. AV19 TaxID=2793068 RepID=UPI0018FEFCC8|nr:CGNR zinc finger domain-containing protein [Streptomyces sp. AV19]MBH1937887.1 CGNR zinc finger domain-containing protein [Streptomyces sp. AV19]MDG4536514.1 CGNR zinc finger domain-containing protein [Streptomyces sp. AV19]
MRFTRYTDPSVTLAEELVNTYDTVRGAERLTDVATLCALFVRHGIRLNTVPTGADLAAARRLRPVLREVFAAPRAHTAVALLNQVLADHRAVPHYTDHDGSWHLHVAPPDAGPLDQYAANAAMALLGVITTSGAERLHVCAGSRCAEVFVDTSRNQSRRYCSPLLCGNRAHAAAHRARRRSTAAGA